MNVLSDHMRRQELLDSGVDEEMLPLGCFLCDGLRDSLRRRRRDE